MRMSDFFALLLACALLSPGAAWGQRLPSGFPEKFSIDGTEAFYTQEQSGPWKIRVTTLRDWINASAPGSSLDSALFATAAALADSLEALRGELALAAFFISSDSIFIVSGSDTLFAVLPPGAAPQTLSISGQDLSISGGNTVALPLPDSAVWATVWALGTRRRRYAPISPSTLTPRRYLSTA
jgi:hypothetical protein